MNNPLFSKCRRKKAVVIYMITIFIIFSFCKSKEDDIFRNLNNTSNSEKIENFSEDPVRVREQYKSKCSLYNDPIANKMDLADIVKKNDEVEYLLGNFSSFFKASEETTLALYDTMESVGLNEQKLLDKIDVYIKIVIPFIIVLIFGIVCWIICCSCCCYDYCAVICKKPESFENSGSIRMKIIPIVVLIFFGFKSLIPLINSFTTFNLFENKFKNFYCTTLRINYMIKTGYDLNQGMYVWNGYHNSSFKVVKNFSSGWIHHNVSQEILDEFNDLFNNFYDDFVPFISDLPMTNTLNETNEKDFLLPRVFTKLTELRQKSLNDSMISFMEYFDSHNPTHKNPNHTTPQKEFLDFIDENINITLSKYYHIYDYYLNIRNNPKYFEKIMNKISENYEVNGKIDNYISNITLVLFTFGYEFFEKYFKFFQTFYLIYQLSVFLIIIAKSLTIYLNIKSKVVKYLAHGLWFFSGLFIILGIVVLTYLYIFGNFNLLFGKALLMNNDPTSPNNTLHVCYDHYNEDQFYLNEEEAKGLPFTSISFLNSTEDYENMKKKHHHFTKSKYNSHQLIWSMNEVSRELLDVHIIVERNDFENILLLQKMKEMIKMYTNPSNAIIDKDGTKIVENSVIFFNNLINDEGYYPFNKYLKCDRFTNFELYFMKEDCKFPFNEDASEIHDLNCYLIPNVTENVLETYLIEKLGNEKCNCTYFLDEPDFCKNLSQLTFQQIIMTGFKALKKFYTRYQEVVEIVNKKILLKIYSLYDEIVRRLVKVLKNFKKFLSDKINEAFRYPVIDIYSIFATKKIQLKNIQKDFLNIELTSYYSCHWFKDYSDFLAQRILMDVMAPLYALFVCYVFMILFNIPIAVITLTTIICLGFYDEKEEKKKIT